MCVSEWKPILITLMMAGSLTLCVQIFHEFSQALPLFKSSQLVLLSSLQKKSSIQRSFSIFVFNLILKPILQFIQEIDREVKEKFIIIN